MNERHHELVSLKSVLLAAQAFRDDRFSESAGDALMKSMQAALVEQRQRYDKFVHARTSKERELETSIDSLRQLRVELAGRNPDKACQKKLHTDRNTYVQGLAKLREAQSVEQMYRSLLLQLDTDHDVTRKDLADMDLACNKVEKNMMQLQQQLKQRSAQHAAALEHHSHLSQSLHVAKKQADSALTGLQQAILQQSGYEGNQTVADQPCTLEAALADAEHGEAQLSTLFQRVHRRLEPKEPDPPLSTSARPNGMSNCSSGATTANGEVENSRAPSLYAPGGEGSTAVSCTGQDALALGIPASDGKNCTQSSADHADADAQDLSKDVLPASAGCDVQAISASRNGLAGVWLGLTESHAGDQVLSGSGDATSRAGSGVLAQSSSDRIVPQPGSDRSNGDIGSAKTNGCSHDQADDICEVDEDGGSRAAGDGEYVDDVEVTQEELMEGWGIVERCLPGIDALAGVVCGGEVEKVSHVAMIVARAQEEMMVVLQQWIATGQAELAWHGEGALHQ